MTGKQWVEEAARVLRQVIGLALLVVVAVTAVELLGVNIPNVSGVRLDQGTGIGLAGLAFLYSKL